MDPSATPATLTLVESRCALCGSDDAETVARGHDYEYATAANEFSFVRCRECAHLYLNPRPSADDLGTIYPPHYYAFGNEGTGVVARARRTWEGGKVRLYRECVGTGTKRILDVGCGSGRFLGLLRDFGDPAWELEGLDIDAEAAADCQAAGFEANVGRIESFESERRYDGILMLQLIEHVEDPAAVARQVFRLLAPGGVFVVETPNPAGLDHRLFQGQTWGHYHFPRHWHLFTDASLRGMLEGEGFEIERHESLISPASWIISMHNGVVARGGPDWLVRLLDFRNPLLLSVFVLADWLRAKTGGATSNQRVIARKPAAAG
ncbi:MAG: class I SAM-dependent methyltransferase [Myxococcota bacterium]